MPEIITHHAGITMKREDTTMAFTSDRRLWLNADRSAVVEDGDPAAAYLLVGEGGEVPTAVVRQYGLKSPGQQPADTGPGPAKDPADSEDLSTIKEQAKAQVQADNKAVTPKADK